MSIPYNITYTVYPHYRIEVAPSPVARRNRGPERVATLPRGRQVPAYKAYRPLPGSRVLSEEQRKAGWSCVLSVVSAAQPSTAGP